MNRNTRYEPSRLAAYKHQLAIPGEFVQTPIYIPQPCAQKSKRALDTMSGPIILYDIPGRNTEYKAWSPNTWNTRFALNFKGIPYKTEWVEYPDIEALAKKIGAEPTTKKTDGRDHYTLPIVHDPSTGAVVADSLAIALYLDKTYPNAPLLFPPNTKTLTAIAASAFGRYISSELYNIVVLGTWKNLNEASQGYFRKTRESDLGLKLEEFAPAGPVGEAKWKAVERGFNQFNTWIGVGGTEFITGNQIAYADIIFASQLIWAKVVLGSQSKEWQRIAGWNGGKLGRFLESFEKYSTVV